MYQSHWQLTQKPFENCCDVRFYFPGESHQAALLKLRYAVESRRGGAVLAGPPGSGKTFLVHMLRAALGPRFAPIVHLVFPQMPTEQLLAYLCAELTGEAPTNGTATTCQSIRRMQQFLAENSRRGQHALLLIDEAHLIDEAPTWEALRLIMNFECSGEPGWTIVLVGQTALLPAIDRVPQFEERLSVKSLLRPFTLTETGQYVSHRLRVAGGRPDIFPPDALAELHRLTHGIPRRINRLCDLALLIGYAEGRHSIAADELDSIQQELVSVAPE